MSDDDRTGQPGAAARDYLEITGVLRRGDPDELEFVHGVVDGFPEGQDPYLGLRWITNAIDCGAPESVAWMLAKGVALDFRDSGGYTPVHSCLERDGEDRYRVLDMLLRAGAPVNAHGFNDWTPLHMAAAVDDRRAMRMLLEAGADRTIRTRIDDCTTPEEEARLLGQHAAADFLKDDR